MTSKEVSQEMSQKVGQEVSRQVVKFKHILIGLDFETTGLKKADDQITEIGVVLHGYVEDTKEYFLLEPIGFSTLVRTDRVISEKVTQITGLDTKKLSEAPEIHIALQNMLQYIDQHCGPYGDVERILVAYNGKTFDLPILINELLRSERNPVDFIESLRLTYSCDPFIMAKTLVMSVLLPKNKRGRPSYMMGDVYAALFKKPLVNAHSAKADVAGMLEILESPLFHATFETALKTSTLTDYLFDTVKFVHQFLGQKKGKPTATVAAKRKVSDKGPKFTIRDCIRRKSNQSNSMSTSSSSSSSSSSSTSSSMKSPSSSSSGFSSSDRSSFSGISSSTSSSSFLDLRFSD